MCTERETNPRVGVLALENFYMALFLYHYYKFQSFLATVEYPYPVAAELLLVYVMHPYSKKVSP